MVGVYRGGVRRASRRVSALLVLLGVCTLALLWTLVSGPAARADETPAAATPVAVQKARTPAPSPSRTVLLPSNTIIVTDNLGNTVAAVGGVATSRAPSGPTSVGSRTDQLARTGRHVGTQIVLGVGLLVAGGGLVTLGARRKRHAH